MVNFFGKEHPNSVDHALEWLMIVTFLYYSNVFGHLLSPENSKNAPVQLWTDSCDQSSGWRVNYWDLRKHCCG